MYKLFILFLHNHKTKFILKTIVKKSDKCNFVNPILNLFLSLVFRFIRPIPGWDMLFTRGICFHLPLSLSQSTQSSFLFFRSTPLSSCFMSPIWLTTLRLVRSTMTLGRCLFYYQLIFQILGFFKNKLYSYNQDA